MEKRTLVGLLAAGLLAAMLPGAAAATSDSQGADPAAPEMVEVTTLGAPIIWCDDDSETSETVGPIERTYGSTCQIQHKWSDSRLKGTETYVANGVFYDDSSELSIGHYVHSIVTEYGAWRMRPQFRFESSLGGPGDFSGTWDWTARMPTRALAWSSPRTKSEASRASSSRTICRQRRRALRRTG